MMNLSISKGNAKLGNVGNFSLPPIKTCKAGVACAEKCYALKSYRQYPNVRTAWDKNLYIVKHDLEAFKSQMVAHLTRYRKDKFRIHVSGDFFSVEYLKAWVEIIEAFPRITFLAYTKQADIVDAYWMEYGSLPLNMVMYESLWLNESPVLNELPTASVIGAKEVKEDGFTCQGSCKTCKACYTGVNVNFNMH